MRHISEVIPVTREVAESIEQRIRRGEQELARVDPDGLELLRRKDAELSRVRAGGDQ